MSDRAKPIDRLAEILIDTRRAVRVTNDLKRRHFGIITGVITNVADPAEKGRVKVKLDAYRQEYEVEEWAYVAGAYQGHQPRQLIGVKCLIAPIEGSTHLYRVIDILDGDIGTFDPNVDGIQVDHHIDSYDYSELQELKSLESRTGTMFRLPVYSVPAGDVLPVCHGKNHGAQIVYDDGLNSKVATCLRVKGGFGWVTSQRKKLDNNF